jgi:radical SAM superfamily enzyme YgiQ (UPF0313 family)
MRVCLVGPPTLADFDDLAKLDDESVGRVPLGVLTLASELGRRGLSPEVLDLDALYGDWRAASRRRADFAGHAAEELAGRHAEVYGFGSLCGSYPLTLRIAVALRDLRPGCRIVLGGPQATATASETLAAFPAVDVVARGEGETVLPALLEALASAGDLSSVQGISYRTDAGVAHTPDAAPVEDLDLLPVPAYHLYPKLRSLRSLPVEAGRGCPFACTFCSTSRFFGRRFRLKSAGRIVQEMLALRRAYGARSFDLVHDNLTVDRPRVVAFCEAVSSCGVRLTWSCSSRTDTLDDDLIDLMGKAGCRGIFFGVESASGAIQRRIRKRLDLQEARDRLRHVSRRRIPAAVAFITGFPEETVEDLRDTAGFFVDALRFDYLEPQLGLLSPLAGTPIHARHRHELFRDEVISDLAFQGERLDRADAELIDRYPALFSSYWSVPTPGLDRRDLFELRAFLHNARFDLRWLLVAAAQVAGGGWEAYRGFRAWHPRAGGGESPRALTAYYRSRTFREDFLRFVREDLSARCGASGHALRALASYYASLHRDATAPGASRRARASRAVPVLAPDVRLARLGCDGAALLRCLRRGGDLARVPRRASALVTRLRRGRNEILRVGEQAADLLELCDGTRDARAVARAFRRLHPEVGGVPAKTACAVGLASFRRRGFLASWAPALPDPLDRAAPSRSPGGGRRRELRSKRLHVREQREVAVGVLPARELEVDHLPRLVAAPQPVE